MANTQLAVLIAWPAAQGQSLARHLRQRSSEFDITAIPENALDRYISAADAYDVLCITPGAWGALQPHRKEHVAACKGLVVMGPQPGQPGDLPAERTCVYVAGNVPADEAVRAVMELQVLLLEGTPLSRAAAAFNGTLAWIGTEYQWRRTTPGPLSTHQLAERPSGQVSLPQATAIPGTSIGSITVHGDVVASKVVYHAEGDQVNQGGVRATKIVQEAGGNQVNINRIQSPVESLHQRAGEDQVNLNRVTASPRKPVVCPDCGEHVEPGYNYCMKCSADVRGIGGRAS